MPDETINQLIGYSAFIAMVEPELGKTYLEKLYPFISVSYTHLTLPTKA